MVFPNSILGHGIIFSRCAVSRLGEWYTKIWLIFFVHKKPANWDSNCPLLQTIHSFVHGLQHGWRRLNSWALATTAATMWPCFNERIGACWPVALSYVVATPFRLRAEHFSYLHVPNALTHCRRLVAVAILNNCRVPSSGWKLQWDSGRPGLTWSDSVGNRKTGRAPSRTRWWGTAAADASPPHACANNRPDSRPRGRTGTDPDGTPQTESEEIIYNLKRQYCRYFCTWVSLSWR